MKKFNFAKIVSLVFVCAMLLCALAVTALAQDETTVEIVSNNVYYGEKLQIMYAIKAPEGATMKAVDSEGNEIKVLPFKDKDGNTTTNIGGTDYPMYILKDGVSVQAIDEKITLTVTAGEESVTRTYSVLQYVYERTQALNAKEQTEEVTKELAMLDALVSYADATNAFINGATVSFNDYKYVTVVNGTLDGNNTAGMFLPGAKPFENIEGTLEHNSSTDHIEWDVTVGENTTHYTDNEIKTLPVANENMTLTAVLVKNTCIHEWADATCTTPKTCTKCGEKDGEELAEHQWTGWTVNEATCSEDGEKFRICDVCKKEEKVTIEATGLHTAVTDAAVAPTCTVKGLTEGSHCEVCGEVLVAQEDVDVNPNNHVFVDGKCACGAVQTTVTVNIGEYATANSWANSTKYGTVIMDNSITVTATGGSNTGKYYSSGKDWRIYQNENPAVTVTAKNGNIISVKVTYTVSNTGVLTLNGTNIASGDVVTVNAKSVEFSVGNTGTVSNGNVKITEIEVVYGVAAHECDYSEATCTTLATCTICGETKGELADHSWVDATCVAPKTCSVCSTTEGDALGHTDENPADHTCDVCTVTNISACIDKDADNACDICGEDMGSGEEPEQPNVPTTGYADFDTIKTNTSYSSGSSTNGWTYKNSAVVKVGDITSIAINGKKTAVGSIVSPTLSGGVSSITFDYTNTYSESNGVDITIYVKQNGAVVATYRLDDDSVTQKVAETCTWVLDTQITGDFVIEFVNNSPSNNSTSNKDRASIFNVEWNSAY